MNVKNYNIKSRLWIEGPNGTFLAEGRINLLQNIVVSGSISKAAKEMKMSYKKAWEMIDGMNSESSQPVVNRVSGGKFGGGTEVTDYGKKMIVIYNELNKKCHDFLKKEISKIEF